jgi:hypothetical protein
MFITYMFTKIVVPFFLALKKKIVVPLKVTVSFYSSWFESAVTYVLNIFVSAVSHTPRYDLSGV